MKHLPKIMLLACLSLLFLFARPVHSTNVDTALNGAWKITTGDIEELLLIADDYCMISKFDKKNKRFIMTMGGPLTINKNNAVFTIQFNSEDKDEVGKNHEIPYSITGNILSTSGAGGNQRWERADDGKSALAGNWRITKRKTAEGLSEIPLRSRRTLKLLSGKYFQWAAINIETGEFSGTGGGRYNFENGKYTEHIDFFSRDNSRVGASLSFDGKVENKNWIHSGLSSKGEPIYEIWSRFKE